MALTATVSLNGPLFSSLYYELANSSGDQEGFLLGEIKRHVTDVINDAEIATSKEELVINLTSVLPCERIHWFYSNSGELLENNLNALIGNKLKEVVGWYRFRRRTCNEPMIMEQHLHRHLAQWCFQHLTTQQQQIRQQLFLFGIFTSSASENLATHSFDHTFFRYFRRAFEDLACTVINLGDTSQSDYKSQSHLVLPVYLEVVDRLIQQSNTVPGGTNSAVAQIACIHNSLEANLQTLYNQVSHDEALVRKLKRDVELMRNQLRIRESAAASPATPSTPDPDNLWLNTQSLLPTTNTSGLSRSSSTTTNTSAVHQSFGAPPRYLAVGRRQSPAIMMDTRNSRSNNVAWQTAEHPKQGMSLAGVSPCVPTTDCGGSVPLQGSVFAMLPTIGQSAAAPAMQNFGTSPGMVFGRGTTVADGQSSKMTKHIVPQTTNETAFRSSEVPELSSRVNTNPFRLDAQFVSDESRDADGTRSPVGKR